MGDVRMLKDKMIQMDSNNSYYVLEETEYNNRKYILSIECDLDKDSVNEEDCFVMEVLVDGDELLIKHVDDESVAKIVIELLMDKIRKK